MTDFFVVERTPSGGDHHFSLETDGGPRWTRTTYLRVRSG